MRSVIQYFIKYPIAANLLMISVLIFGVIAMFNLKSTFFPEVESRTIFIQLVYPGASPEEIEEGIINKIEENLKGVTGVERIESVSRENSGTVTIEIFKGYKIDVVLQDVKNAVDRINSFPVGLEPPVIYKLENLGFAISFAISGEVDLETLKRYGRKAEEDLLLIDGISKVQLSGFPEQEIEISFREQDLRTYGLTFEQATLAVRAANLQITGGTVKGKEEDLLVRANNKSYFAEGLRNIVVKQSTGGGVVRLHQIADIRDQWAENDPTRTYLNGRPSVVVTVQNTLQEDMISITDKVKSYIKTFNEENKDVQASIVRDGSIVLKDRIGLLTENGILGFLIVVVLLAVFLHWSLAGWVAVAIPISFAGMFICALMLGVTINVISLFGMILVIGILVDDGIVIGENIYQYHERGIPPLQAAVEGTMKVLPAVFSAILTTIVAFSAFFFLDGTLGDFFKEMAIVVICSLIFSLIEGAFILPTHIAHSRALNADKNKTSVVQRAFEAVLSWFRDRLYAPVLKFAMANKFLTVAVMVTVLMITFGAIGGGLVKTTFFPVIERDNITIEFQMPAGTNESVTIEWLNHLENAAWKANTMLSKQYFNGEKPAILNIQKNIGPSTYEGTLDIALLEGEYRDSLRLREIVNAIRTEAGPIYQAEVVSFAMQSAFGKPIVIALKGEDNQQLSLATAKVKAELEKLKDLSDVIDDNQEGLKEINLKLKDKALYLGLNLQEVVNQVRQGFFGSEVQRLQRGRDEVRVWVRYDREDRSDVTDLEKMRVRFLDGREFPLSEIADLEMERGVISINHLDGKRTVKIEADVSNDEVSVSDLTTSLRDEILPSILKDYPGVTATFEGQNREQQKFANSMMQTSIVILAVMFLIIALTFRSIGQTISVFAMIPFAMVGVGWGHFAMDMPISLFSTLGLIALIGILVNDALVMVATYNDLIEEGMPQMEAVYEAGVSRFRAILLTSVTTIAGLAPLIFEKSLQAQFLIPMAVAVSFGLLATTIVTLILLPVLLIVVNRLKVQLSMAWNGVKPSYEAVEPASGVDGGYQYFWYVLFGVAGFAGVVFYLLTN